MKEDLLQYIWQFGLFSSASLKTVNNEVVEIESKGQLNTDSGPDFFNAKIKIADTLWAGNVEIHVKTSDWKLHNHSLDKAYNNVILHVVWEHDSDINSIPVLELKNLVNPHLINQYESWMQNQKWIPCADEIHKVPLITINSTLDKLLIERLEAKSNYILQLLQFNNSDWEETLYQTIAKAFGLKINSGAFELLAKSLPYKILLKHKYSLLQIEALLFGQAGFLDQDCKDEYFLNLQKEYKFLQQKFNLKPIQHHLWKFMRLRPPNFPTIRISQFASLIFNSNNLFSVITKTSKINELYDLFTVETNEYWQTHYVFGKESKTRHKHFGKSAINTIIINVIVPFLFVYGKQRNKPNLVTQSLKLLEKLPAEKNAIIEGFENLKIKVNTAYKSQALLQLKNEYCTPKKCLNCGIAFQLLK